MSVVILTIFFLNKLQQSYQACHITFPKSLYSMKACIRSYYVVIPQGDHKILFQMPEILTFLSHESVMG